VAWEGGAVRLLPIPIDAKNNFHIDFKLLSARRQTIDSQELKVLAQSVVV
jgi:hypothetical protein